MIISIDAAKALYKNPIPFSDLKKHSKIYDYYENFLIRRYRALVEKPTVHIMLNDKRLKSFS
jgi:hypothetical protein